MYRLCFTIVTVFTFNYFVHADEPSKKEMFIIQSLCDAESFQDIYAIKDSIGIEEFGYVPSIMPISEKYQPQITSKYGYRNDPITNKRNFHSGMDFKAKFGATIHSTADGEVIFSGKKGSYGMCIVIKHNYGFETIYAHLTLCYCKKGDVIKKGQRIGFVGSTGKSTGAHLHYEIVKNNKKIDPADFLNIQF